MSVQSYIAKLDAIVKVNRQYPKKAGVIALKFTKDRFRARNWIGTSTEPWKQKKFPFNDHSAGTRSGALRRSYRITRSTTNLVVIGTDKVYAQAINDGASIKITDKMRKFWWAKHYELKKQGKSKEAQFWLNMAVTKKKHIIIPARRHIGESQYLTRDIERQITLDYSKALKA